MLDFLAGRRLPLIFLKAVQKKQIYIPAFVRADGTTVAGHMKWVHVADDHDDHKVAHGAGTHSQKIAHGKLSKKDWYQALPTEHKAAVVMAHATDHQTLESAGSRVSKMRDKILKGIKPAAGEWRSWGYIDADRRQKEYDAITAAGKGAFFQECMDADEVAKGVEDRKERLDHQQASAADVQAAEQPKEEPKAEPAPAPAPPPAKEEPKDEPKHDAPAAEPQPAAPAQPEEAPATATAEALTDVVPAKAGTPAAAGALAMPTFDGGKTGATVTEYYELKAQQIIDMAAAGDVAGLEKMKADFLKPKASGGMSKTFAGKTPNSKTLIALHDAALAQAKEWQVNNTFSMPDTPTVDAGPKEGDTKPAADGGTLVLKDGHWIKQDEPQASPALVTVDDPAQIYLKQADESGAGVSQAAMKWLHANPGKDAELSGALVGMDLISTAKMLGVYQEPAAPPVTPDSAPAGPVGLTDAEIGGKPVGVSSTKFKMAVEHAKAGDLAALQAIQQQAESEMLPNTAAHLATMVDALKVKQGGAPAAESVPVKPDSWQKYGIFASLKDDIDEAVTKDDKGTLESIKDYLNTPRNKAEVGAKEMLAYLAEKAPANAPVDTPAPAAGGSMKLTDAEIPTPVSYADTDACAEGAQYAKKGDIEAVQTLAEMAANDAKPATAKYLNGLAAQMQAKAGGAPAAADDTPKDGDTKQGANGTLVFQNGRWHKQGDDPKVLKQKAASVPLPKLSGTNAVKMGKVAKALKEIAETQGAAGLAKLIQQTGGKTTFKAAGYSFFVSNDPDVASSNGTKLINYANALQAAMSGTQGAAPAAPKATAAAAVSSTPDAAISMDGWTKYADKKGFNDGGFFKDESGQEWYCKFPAGGEAVIKNELLANKLTGLSGLNVPDLQLVKKGGQLGLASKIIPGAQENKAALLEGKAEGLLESFAVHAWLANWDSVGNNPSKGFDNILIDGSGKAHHIDQGGALLYGGAGGAKGQFSEKVIELKTMLDAGKNANTAAVFGKMSSADIAASVKKVAMISDDAILSYCMKFGPGDNAAKQALAAKLIARKKDMLAQFPKAAKATHGTGTNPDDLSWVKLNPGEKIVEHGTKFGGSFAKIEIPAKGFNADGIPSPFTYDKSGSQFVNAANTADIKSVYDTALASHDPAAVLALKYPEIVKATGEKTGKMLTIDEHPSKAYVKEYVNQVAAELAAQLQPTYKVEHRGSFSAGYSAAAAEIAALVKPISHANFKHWASKAADYLVLDKAAGAGVPTPEAGMFSDVEPSDQKMVDFKKASDAKYATLTSSEKSACVAYTGSAYANWNSAMRLGTVDSAEFKAGEPMRKAFHKAAVELPEGIILHRGIGVGGDTYKSVIGAVIQDGSFQSCSYGKKAAFSGHESQLRLHIGKGVKGMMATSFSKFGSGERELILHPNCRYVVMGVTKENGKNMVDILVLPHEE